MKDFKEWCKDKVIAFTEGYSHYSDYVYDWGWINNTVFATGINGVQHQEYPNVKAQILWMLKSEYDKLDNPKDYIGKWNQVPQQFEKYCDMFNEKTRIC